MTIARGKEIWILIIFLSFSGIVLKEIENASPCFYRVRGGPLDSQVGGWAIFKDY